MLIFGVCAVIISRAGCFHHQQSSWQPASNDYYHFDHPHEDYDYKPTMPLDIMVDMINDLGIKLLAIHNEHNEDNIAISPYGAVSVLAALSEGVDGDAVHEIIHAAHFPKDRHITRVGLRDIHRHLKSYFIPQEGFLAGLTLNLNNVTLRKDYEEVLRFYGFDYGSFNNALYPEPPTTQKSTTASEIITSVSTRATTTTDTTTPLTTTDLEKTTTITAQNISETMVPTTTTTSTTTTSPETTVSISTITTQETKTETTTTTTTSMPSTTKLETLTTQETTTSDKESTTLESTTILTTTEALIPTNTTISLPPGTTTLSSDSTVGPSTSPSIDVTTTSEKLNLATTTVQPELDTTEVPVVGTPQNFATAESQFQFQQPDDTTTPPPLYEDITNTPSNEDTTPLNPDFDYSYNYQDSNLPVENNGSFTANYDEMAPARSASFNNNFKRKARSIGDYVIARYYDNHHQNLQHVPPEPLTFLIYGKYRESGIQYMKYHTLLPFYYSPNLNALALSFPLDSTKYYLLLLLPVDETGIDQLICDLRLHGSLKYIVENLKMSYVTASIPSFMLKGYVTLTPTLQQLGIRKVFEPRQADFAPMANRNDIYVTNIEQAVTVTIRNYMDPSSEKYKNVDKYDPVYFIADHPFLYFVLDSELHVTLVAGKVVNPLNSRIR